MLEQIATAVIPALVGAAGTGVPLYISLRKALADIKEGKEKLLVEIESKKNDVANAQKINVEAEWKRVIDEKEKELIRLRAKDDEQEAKISDLLTKHIECQKNEARSDERLKNFEASSKEQSRQIKALTTKLLQLDKLVRGPNAHQQSGSGTHEALLGIVGFEETQAGSRSGESVRPGGGSKSGDDGGSRHDIDDRR